MGSCVNQTYSAAASFGPGPMPEIGVALGNTSSQSDGGEWFHRKQRACCSNGAGPTAQKRHEGWDNGKGPQWLKGHARGKALSEKAGPKGNDSHTAAYAVIAAVVLFPRKHTLPTSGFRLYRFVCCGREQTAGTLRHQCPGSRPCPHDRCRRNTKPLPSRKSTAPAARRNICESIWCTWITLSFPKHRSSRCCRPSGRSCRRSSILRLAPTPYSRRSPTGSGQAH